MTPGARGVREDQVGDRLAHRDRRDRDHPSPLLRAASRAPPRCTSRSSTRQFSSNACAVRRRASVRREVARRRAAAVGDQDVDAAERVAARRGRTRPRRRRSPTSATSGTAPRPISRRGGVDPRPRSRPQIATVHAFGGERRGGREAEPLRRRRHRGALVRRSRGPCALLSVTSVDRAGGCRAATDAGAAGAQRDDLGADRRPPSPPACGRRCRARSAPCTRASSASVDARLAQPLDALVVGAARAHRAEVADLGRERADDRGHVELGVVGEHAHRVARPELVADLREVAGRASRPRPRRPSGTAPRWRTPRGRRTR